MAKRGLPNGVGLRHDSHYVEDLARTNRSVGRLLPIDKIEPNPEQPRVEIGDLTELSSSIKEKGVLEPLLVKPNRQTGTWMIIAGERRWRASNLAGLREVPCIELDIDEKEVAEIALIENLQRKDLNVWEEADGLAALGSRFGYTHDEIARKIGKSRTTVTEAMAIAGLPGDIRRKCIDARINAKSTLLEIARQFDENAMHQFLERIQNKNREEIRQAARPHLSSKAEPFTNSSQASAGKRSNTENTEKRKVFRYISEDKDFSIEIFSKNKSFGNAEIKDALQQALNKLQEE
ncbi:MAG TPA: ParB/RepB/Spo0J family partition protein [Pyrinomonadaceae bacterium]